MKLKQEIKKIGALAGTGAMLLTSVVAPASAQLEDLPAPFVEDGVFQGKIVVGESAATADVLGAVDIAARFQADATTPVTVTGGGEVEVSGGEDIDDQQLNEYISAQDLDDTELEGFFDSTVTFDSEDIDILEQFMIDANGVQAATSLIDEDYEENIVMEASQGTVKYRVQFEDAIDDAGFNDDELEIPFLGRNLEITGLSGNNTNTDVTLKASSDFFLEQGDAVDVADREVTLVRVGESSVIVEVDGQREVIESGNSERFDEAGDLEVEVDSVFYVEGADDNGANLEIGQELTETAEDGQSAEVFGQPSEEDDADWVWDINLTEGSEGYTGFLGIRSNQDYDGMDADDTDERDAIMMGEELSLPNDRASITFQSLEESEMSEVSLQVRDSEIDLDDDSGTSEDDLSGVVFSSADDEDIYEVDGESTEEAYFVWNGSEYQLWYQDGEDEVQYSTWDNTTSSPDNSFELQIDDQAVTVTLPTELPGSLTAGTPSSHINMEFPLESTNNEALRFYADLQAGVDYFGTEDEDEGLDLYYDEDTIASGAGSAFGTADYTVVTDYGVTIETPEDQFGSGDTFEMMVPQEQQKANFVVATRDTQVSAGGSGSGDAVTVNRIPVGLAVLDSEAEALLGDEPLVVVGGPFVNTVADELLGSPSTADIEEMFSPGTAKIQMFEDENALLVAGFNAEDTLGASYVVANYDDYDLEGEEVEVVLDGSTVVSVQEPSEE